MKYVLITLFMLTSFGFSESFEEYQKREMKEFSDYQVKRQKEIESWKKERENFLKNWEKELDYYKKNGTHRVKVNKSENTISKHNIDYKKSEVNVDVVSKGKTKEEAVQKAKSEAKKEFKEALLKTDPTLKEHVKEEDVDKQINKGQKKVIVKKTKDGYMAQYKGKSSMKELAVKAVEKESSKKKKAKNKKKIKTDYSSLIVDATNLDFKACLVPMIIDKNGNQLYGPKFVDKSYALNGMVQWEKSITSAKKNKKTGSKPFIIKADSIKNKRRIVVNDKEAEVLAMLDESKIFQQCRVIILLN